MSTSNADPIEQPNAKILIVDDEMAMRFLLEGQIRRAGYQVATAASGAEALTSAETFQPDLVLLDLMMPGMNGFDVCTQIRQRPALAHTRVVFLTASMTRTNRERAFDVGADDYLLKPHQLDTLLRRIAALLCKRSANDQTDGQLLAFWDAQHRAQTTELLVGLADELTLTRPVVLVDFSGKAGALAKRLDVASEPSGVDLLTQSPSAETLLHAAVRYRSNCWVLPADRSGRDLDSAELETIAAALNQLRAAGLTVLIDAGATLTPLTLMALQTAERVAAISAETPQDSATLATQLGIAPTCLQTVTPSVQAVLVEMELVSAESLAPTPKKRVRQAEQQPMWLMPHPTTS